jgi:hypothetical protein
MEMAEPIAENAFADIHIGLQVSYQMNCMAIEKALVPEALCRNTVVAMNW